MTSVAKCWTRHRDGGFEAEILHGFPKWSPCKCAGGSCGSRKQLLGEVTLEIVS